MPEGQTSTPVEQVVITGSKAPPSARLSFMDVAGIALDPAGAARDFVHDRMLGAIGNGDISGYSKRAISAVVSSERVERNPNGQSKLTKTFQKVSGSLEGIPLVERQITRAIGSAGRIAESTQDGAGATAGSVLKEGAFVAGMALGPAAGILGGAVSGGFDAERDAGLLKKGIEGYAARNVPGFGYEEKNINGSDVKVWVDASKTIDNPRARPWMVVEAGSGATKDEVRTFADAVREKTLSGVQEFKYGIFDQNANNDQARDERDERVTKLSQAIADDAEKEAPVESAPEASEEAIDPRIQQINDLQAQKIPDNQTVANAYNKLVTNAAGDMMPKAPAAAPLTPQVTADVTPATPSV